MLACGCTQTQVTVLPYPIPMQLGAGGGALLAMAATDDQPTPFPIVVDTGTVLTAYDNGRGLAARNGNFTLYGVDAAGAPLERMLITNLQLFNAPFFPVGVGAATTAVRGVLAGDNLQRFAVTLDYRGSAPTMTLLPADIPQCSCELSQVECQAVLPFSLTGGQETGQQGQVRVAFGNDQFAYPATRLLLDACLEPLGDPLTIGIVCDANDPCVMPDPHYLPSGVDVKMLVATGFPGVALSANAFDRLRGAGASDAAFASATVALHLPDADNATSGAGVTAAVVNIGASGAGSNDPGRSALALVSHDSSYGPCASMARSRRLRVTHKRTDQNACFLDGSRNCGGVPNPDIYTASCLSQHNDQCWDTDDRTVVPAVIELRRPRSILVLRDLTPLLVGINQDVRPSSATVEGIVGSDVLRELVTTIDYPGRRFFARCVGDSSQCLAYAQIVPQKSADCSYCLNRTDDGAAIKACPVAP